MAAVILHGSQNTITQGFFSEYTSESDNMAYLVSEVGILIAAAWVVAAYLFWRRRGEVAGQVVAAARR